MKAFPGETKKGPSRVVRERFLKELANGEAIPPLAAAEGYAHREVTTKDATECRLKQLEQLYEQSFNEFRGEVAATLAQPSVMNFERVETAAKNCRRYGSLIKELKQLLCNS